MNLIFSADANWGIGKENALLFHAKGDMAFFKRMTQNHVVVMGRRTLESLPGGKPLPQRTNFVLTRNTSFEAPDGVTVCTSLDALFAQLIAYADADIFVIGGEQIYRQLMPYASTAYVTLWDAAADADSFAPNLEQLPGWRRTGCSAPVMEQGCSYRFCTYQQARPKRWRPVPAPASMEENDWF